MAEISVIVPARNAAHTIERALGSVLEELTNIDCIVIDDGSTDATADRVLGMNDSRVRLITQVHAGVAAAANRAVQESVAPLIARMDADDVALPGRLTRQLQFLRQHDLDIVGGQVNIVDQDSNPVLSMARYQRWINSLTNHNQMAAYRFVETPIVNPTALVRHEVFELGYRDGPFPEDYDLWLRAFAAGFRFGILPEPVLDWVDGPTRLTRSDDRYSFAAFDRSRREHLLSGPLKDRGVVNLWGAGQTGKPWLRWLRDQQREIEFVVDISPGKIGKLIHGTPVISPKELPGVSSSNTIPLLIAVGREGARELIEPVIQKAGYQIGNNAWFVA
ncbi:MAG: glycosyltransferase [Verrucomicrobiia bacterium]|jgi:glycosyltransferase involved in cell wall biosynthesis